MGKKSQGVSPRSTNAGASNQARAMLDQAFSLHRSGQLAQAESVYEALLQAHPRHFDALRLYGVLTHQTKRPQMAISLFSRALEVKPKSDQVYFDIGWVFQTVGHLTEALLNYDNAVRLKPNYVEAHYNRGVVLKDLHRLNESLASFNKAIALKPNFADAHIYRGLVLMDLKRVEEALVSYDRAIVLKPNAFEPHCNRALALLALQKPDEALASFNKAVALKPDLVEADNSFLFGDLLHAKMMICDWQGLDEDLKKLKTAVQAGRRVALPFIALSLLDSPEFHQQIAKIYIDARFPPKNQLGPIAHREKGEKIRLGYYSADFYNHATSYLMAGLFESHDRSQFELFGFSFGPDKRDEMGARIAASFDHFIDARGRSDVDIAHYSRELGIDIAIDLKGFTNDLRTGIFAERCAPIQINYLGYPGTMAAEYMDYIVADATVIPPEERKNYTEKVVYLPHSYQVNDSSRQISDRIFSKQECDLPESGFVFCCFNNSFKILPSTFYAWMRILKAVEGSVLWLLESNPTAAKNLQKEAESQGVDGKRLIFAKRMPLSEHLARHRLADLFLDTLPYNAHTTASDALWAGLPVLTCLGESFASRVSASLLRAVDLPELVVASQSDYEARAIELASNRAQLLEINSKLENNKSTAALFDTGLFAKHIESAYKLMYDKYQAGQPPESIEIN